MALYIEKQLETGVVANYHSISVITIKHKNVIIVTLSIHLSKDAKASGKVFLGHVSFELGIEDAIEAVTDSAYDVVYNALKAQPYFAGATDC